MDSNEIESKLNDVRLFLRKSIERHSAEKKLSVNVTLQGEAEQHAANGHQADIEAHSIKQAVASLLDTISLKNFDVKRKFNGFNTFYEVSTYALNEKSFNDLVENVAIMALKDALIFEADMKRTIQDLDKIIPTNIYKEN